MENLGLFWLSYADKAISTITKGYSQLKNRDFHLPHKHVKK